MLVSFKTNAAHVVVSFFLPTTPFFSIVDAEKAKFYLRMDTVWVSMPAHENKAGMPISLTVLSFVVKE